MKKLLLYLVLASYPVGASFDVAGFLASCAASGIKLSSTTNGESLNGFFSLSAGVLTVTLYEKQTTPTTDPVCASCGVAGQAVLPGKLSAYKPTIDAAVAANK